MRRKNIRSHRQSRKCLAGFEGLHVIFESFDGAKVYIQLGGRIDPSHCMISFQHETAASQPRMSINQSPFHATSIEVDILCGILFH